MDSNKKEKKREKKRGKKHEIPSIITIDETHGLKNDKRESETKNENLRGP